MCASIQLHLFGKPAVYLDEGGPVTAQQLRELGQDLKAHLDKAADALQKLQADGWQVTMCLYDVELVNPSVKTAKEAEERLKALGIDPTDVGIDAAEDEVVEWVKPDREHAGWNEHEKKLIDLHYPD
jgi:hypothetical protein